MNGTLHIGDGPKTRCPKPKVVHYACRHDSGSRKPRVRWTVLRANGRIRQIIVERLPVYKLYCPSCQFQYMQPGCLLWSAPCGIYPEDMDPECRNEKRYLKQYRYRTTHTENRTCERCGKPICDRNQSGYCVQCNAANASRCYASREKEAA